MLVLQTPTTWQWLCYSPDMDPRGEEKARLAKNNLVAHSRKGEVQSRVAVPGERCALQRKTGIDGKHTWRSYTPFWRQGTGEGEAPNPRPHPIYFPYMKTVFAVPLLCLSCACLRGYFFSSTLRRGKVLVIIPTSAQWIKRLPFHSKGFLLLQAPLLW